MQTIKLITVTITLAAMLALTGCNRKVMAPGEAKTDPILRENYPRIVALEGLSDYLSFAAATVTNQPGQPMSVIVPVRLRSDTETNVQYQFEFFDAAGRPMRDTPQWRFLHLPARAQYFLSGAALDTTAADWRLQVRPAR